MTNGESFEYIKVRTVEAPPGEVRPKSIGPWLKKEFESPQQLLQFVRASPVIWSGIEHHSRAHHTDPQRIAFAGTATWEEAERLATVGWSEGRRQIIYAASHTRLTSRVSAPLWSFDVAGEYPDVPRFVAGDPECMVTRNP